MLTPPGDLASVWTTVPTPRLRLRRPTDSDADFWVALHSDPALWTHAPHLHTEDPAPPRAAFAACSEHWSRHGFGYWMVEESASGQVVGVAGVRVDGDGLNLYYRFAAAVHGRGFATEAAVTSVALATEWLGDHPVRAVVRPGHERSLRTAGRAGLVEIGTVAHRDDPPGGGPSVLLEAPTARAVGVLSAVGQEEVLDLWSAVNAAGGAVGFPGDVARADVADALAGHAQAMADGMGTAVLLREPAGDLVGMGFVERSGGGCSRTWST